MDNELFELRKEVYGKTGLGRMDTSSPTDYYTVQGKSLPVAWENFDDSGKLTFMLNKGWALPLYTSDYLLEKLPRNIGSYGLEMWSYPSDDGVAFGYYDTLAKRWHQTIPQRGDRLPLKALLKLTLALHEAGELKYVGQ